VKYPRTMTDREIQDELASGSPDIARKASLSAEQRVRQSDREQRRTWMFLAAGLIAVFAALSWDDLPDVPAFWRSSPLGITQGAYVKEVTLKSGQRVGVNASVLEIDGNRVKLSNGETIDFGEVAIWGGR